MLDKSRAVEMNVNVDRARCGDQPLAVAHRGAAGDDQAGIDAIHDGGIAGLAEADDAAVTDAEVALDDPEHGIDNDDVAKQEIQRASALVMPAMPIPSRRVLPPPCRHSSP